MCRGTQVHDKGRPEVPTVNMKLHEAIFTRESDVTFNMIFSRDKVLERVSRIVEMNGTLMKCVVDTGNEV